MKYYILFILILFTGCNNNTTLDENVSAENNDSISQTNTDNNHSSSSPTENATPSNNTNTTEQPTPNNTTTSTTPTNHYQTLIYDTFNSFDKTIWQKADWSNGTPFYNAWCPNQVNFNQSLLTLRLDQLTCHEKTHASGEYRTLDNYKYGRYTVRMKTSNIVGTISSFFTYTGPAEGTQWDEIDIEILGLTPQKIQINYWRNGKEHPKTFNLGFDASKNFHTYSFVWRKEYIQWYVDNTLIYEVKENHLKNNDSLPINPGKIIMNLWAAIGIESWSGKYIQNTSSQAYYDYVKYEIY